MKNLIFFGLFIFLLVAISSCNSDESQIKSAVKQFFTAINQKDMTTAKKYATIESAEILSMIGSHITEMNDTTSTPNDNFFVNNIKINGNAATAEVRTETQKTPITVSLKKESKNWKVAFDKESIMNMIQKDVPVNSPTQGFEDSSAIENDTTPRMDVGPTRRDTQVLEIPK